MHGVNFRILRLIFLQIILIALASESSWSQQTKAPVNSEDEISRPEMETPGSQVGIDAETRLLRRKLDRSPLTVLPPIEAKSYPIEIARRSSSQRIYLFNDPTKREPQEGRILVLKRGVGEDRHNVMAFRIVRIYPEKQQFAVRRIRWYGHYRVLDPGMEFLAVEKKGDIKLTSLTVEDIDDLNEVEGHKNIPGVIETETDPTKNPHSHLNRNSKADPYDEGVDVNGVRIKKYDPMLDAGDAPPPVDGLGQNPSTNESSDSKKNTVGDGKDLDDEVFDADSMEDDDAIAGIDEIRTFEPHHHSLSAELGAIRNNGPSGSSGVFFSPLFRYAFNPVNSLFLRMATVQDSISFEVSAGGYGVTNWSEANAGDSYKVFFVGPMARYNLFITENIGLFIYGGIYRNWVISANERASAPHRAALNSLIPAGGGGLLLKIGPSWFARIDGGYDGVSGGLVLRF